MKVEVKKVFIDKIDRKTPYEVGQVLEWEDLDRINDCVERGLIGLVPDAEEPKPKKTTKKAKQA